MALSIASLRCKFPDPGAPSPWTAPSPARPNNHCLATTEAGGSFITCLATHLVGSFPAAGSPRDRTGRALCWLMRAPAWPLLAAHRRALLPLLPLHFISCSSLSGRKPGAAAPLHLSGNLAALLGTGHTWQVLQLLSSCCSEATLSGSGQVASGISPRLRVHPLFPP